MKVIVDNKLIIKDAPSSVHKWCIQNFIIDNPDYYKKERMGLWAGSTPKEIFLYERSGNDLYLPFGCLQEFHRRFGSDVEYFTKFQPIQRLFYHSDIALYPYQKDAVEAVLRMKNGILVMPCGSGKTQCGLEIISRIGGKALWLTHTQDLLNQSKKRAESVLLQGGYGTITAGKVDIGTHITFATIQTMCKLDLSQYKNEWNVIIVDECQHCCGSPTRVTQFYKVLSNLCARYKIGLTATPKRADGLEASMFALLGGIIHEVNKDVVETTCPIKVQVIETGWMPDYNKVLMGDGTIDYVKVVDNMIHDEDRYNIVFGKLIGKCKEATIVLANRVEYLQKMCKDFIGCGKRAICLSGQGVSKEERKEALRKLNEGEIDCIFATYALAKEGLDVPNLRYVVFATPEKDPTTIIQSAGRVGRKAEGKEYGTVIDFVDSFNLFKRWYSERKSIYKKMEYELT